MKDKDFFTHPIRFRQDLLAQYLSDGDLKASYSDLRGNPSVVALAALFPVNDTLVRTRIISPCCHFMALTFSCLELHRVKQSFLTLEV